MVYYPKIGWFGLSIDLIFIFDKRARITDADWLRGDSFASEYAVLQYIGYYGKIRTIGVDTVAH